MGKWIQQVVEKRLSAPRQGLRVGKGPSPGFARPAGMGQMRGKGERGFRTRGGRLEPGLWPPGSCWHWPREKLVLSPSVKPRRKSSMSVESCAGMSCAPLSPAPKGATARELGEEVAASFQCPPPQGRAELLPVPRSRARLQGQAWTLHWLFTHPSTSRNNEDSKFHVETAAHSYSKRYSSCGWQGAGHKSSPTFLPSSLTPLEAAQPSPAGAGAGEAHPGCLDSASGSPNTPLVPVQSPDAGPLHK